MQDSHLQICIRYELVVSNILKNGVNEAAKTKQMINNIHIKKLAFSEVYKIS